MKNPEAGKKRTLFILNPKAGIPPINVIIAQELQLRKNITCIKSVSVSDTERILDGNLSNYDIFVAAGGDGTVHSVASKLIGTDKVLGVLPAGSGNGFAREFKFRPIIRSLLNDIDNGEYISIDAIEINGNLCLNVAGIGLDSFVAHSFNKLKLRGFLPYMVLTLKTFLQLRPIPVTIVSKGETLMSEDIFVLTIANTRQFGNNAFIAPHALPDDGMMDLVIIRPFPKIIAIVFIYRLFTGNMKESKYVRHIRTSGEVIIKTDESRFHIDGEPFRIHGEVSVTIRPQALRVLKTARYRKFRAKQITGS